MIRPGPSSANQFRLVNFGASINSPVFHRGMSRDPICGASNVALSAGTSALMVVPFRDLEWDALVRSGRGGEFGRFP